MIDTHAHIYDKKYKQDLDEMIQRAKDAGIQKIVLPNIDHKSIDPMLELEEKYKGYCFASMGLHPCSVQKDFEKELYLMEDWLSKRKFIAIGEMGTDLHWDKTYFEQQKEAFKIQVGWAIKYDIPIIIHSRDSIDETIELIETHKEEKLRGVVHCFTGDEIQAKKIIDLGFMIGIGGVLTYKKSTLKEVIPNIPLESIILETDAPYLPPTPHRGKRNEPSYVPLIAQCIGDILQKPLEEIDKMTTDNAMRLFDFSI